MALTTGSRLQTAASAGHLEPLQLPQPLPSFLQEASSRRPSATSLGKQVWLEVSLGEDNLPRLEEQAEMER